MPIIEKKELENIIQEIASAKIHIDCLHEDSYYMLDQLSKVDIHGLSRNQLSEYLQKIMHHNSNVCHHSQALNFIMNDVCFTNGIVEKNQDSGE